MALKSYSPSKAITFHGTINVLLIWTTRRFRCTVRFLKITFFPNEPIVKLPNFSTLRLSSFLILVLAANVSIAHEPVFQEKVDGVSSTVAEVEKAIKKAGKNGVELRSAMKECSGSELESKCIRFLILNMPDADLKVLKSDFLVENIRLAIAARNENEWAKSVPEDIFLNDVMPYASVSETRESWRKDFREKFKGLVLDCKTAGEAAQELNKNVFRILNVKYSTKRKRADQSPSESIETGLASCTGLSVILADACRSVGVPARLAGTPLWINKRGNHTWVEIWDGESWKFTGACEYDANGLNRGWFAGIASQADPTNPIHRIYATSFKKTDIHFPMVWKRRSKEVPAVDVTWRYVGSPKPKAKGEFTVAFKMLDKDGKRVSVDVVVKDEAGKGMGSGQTRNESNDANDFFELNLKPGKYTIERKPTKKSKASNSEDISSQLEFKVEAKANQVFELHFPNN